MTMEKNLIERGAIVMYMNCFQNIKTFSGISGKGQCIIMDNIEALGHITKGMQEAEERFIKTLQTPKVKQANETHKALKSQSELSEADLLTLQVNEKIINDAEEDFSKFKAEYYAVKVEMPPLQKIIREDFYALAERNAISQEDAKEAGAVGLFPQGIAILKKIIYE